MRLMIYSMQLRGHVIGRTPYSLYCFPTSLVRIQFVSLCDLNNTDLCKREYHSGPQGAQPLGWYLYQVTLYNKCSLGRFRTQPRPARLHYFPETGSVVFSRSTLSGKHSFSVTTVRPNLVRTERLAETETLWYRLGSEFNCILRILVETPLAVAQ
jgi:hypothetical protein